MKEIIEKNQEKEASNKQIYQKNTRTIEIGQVKTIRYQKEQDSEGFHRYRIVGKTLVDGILCQVTGYVTQIKAKNVGGG